jgi:hypothetical protein
MGAALRPDAPWAAGPFGFAQGRQPGAAVPTWVVELLTLKKIN